MIPLTWMHALPIFCLLGLPAGNRRNIWGKANSDSTAPRLTRLCLYGQELVFRCLFRIVIQPESSTNISVPSVLEPTRCPSTLTFTFFQTIFSKLDKLAGLSHAYACIIVSIWETTWTRVART